MLATALTPTLGYDAVAAAATEAQATGRSVRDVVLARGLMDPAALDRAFAAAFAGKPRQGFAARFRRLNARVF